MALISTQTRDYVLKLLLLAAAYTAVVYLSLFLVPAGGSGASLVWPPAALALAALYLFGLDLWPALILPFFILLISRGITPPVALGVSLGDTLEAMAGAYILLRFDFHPLLNRLQDSLFLVLAAFAAPVVSATLIASMLHVIGGVPFSQSLWLGLWLGHMVSILSFGPFFIRWAYRPLFRRTLKQLIEGALAMGIFAGLFFLLSWTPYAAIGSISLLYVAIIPLIWITLRMGPRGMALALLIMALLTSTGILFGWGPVAQNSSTAQALFGMQLVVGTLSLIFLIFNSIVEERKEATLALEGHLNRLAHALEQTRSEDQAKADFIAILAHELRNPLSPILSSLEIMKQNGVKGDNRGPVASIASHVHIMARLLDDLLDISRVSQRKFKMQREPVKLSQIAAQSLETVSAHVAGANLTISTSLPKEELWVNGDPVRLVQICANLLSNAIKYTDPGGSVRFSIEREGTDALIEVEDTGIGIDEARQKKIFEPFGAGDDGAPRRGGGLHVGLSLVKRMVELHGGTLGVKSTPAEGSTFSVRLPLLLTAPLLETEPIQRRSRFSRETLEKSRAVLGSLSVLVVDDNEAAAQSLGTLLEVSGHKPSVAFNASQALALCETLEPSVALLDIGLPDMDGYELARRLRAKFDDAITLVALTGYGQQEDKDKAREAGFDEHLIKPVSIVDIEKTLLELARR